MEIQIPFIHQIISFLIQIQLSDTFSIKLVKGFNCLLLLWIFFVILFFSFNLFLCINLLPHCTAWAVQADIGTTIKPPPAIDNVTGVVVAPLKKTVSTDSKIEVGVLKFFYLILDSWFLSLKWVLFSVMIILN